MAAMNRSNWLVPASLALLAVLPLIPGAFRLAELAGGPALLPVNPRVLAAPLPVIVHVVSAAIFYLLGALQFAPGIRRRWPALHRGLGRALLPFGAAVGGSALWMTLLYPMPPESNALLLAFRLVFSCLMLASLGLGLAAILRGDVPTHRAWMIRAYAIGLGAATQMFIFMPLAPLGPLDPTVYSALMGAGWAINLAIAEALIRRQSLPRRATSGA